MSLLMQVTRTKDQSQFFFQKVRASQACPRICLQDFSQKIIFGQTFALPTRKNVPELTRIDQNQTGSVW